MERLVKFVVLGQEYPLYTDAPEEDVQEILQLVRSQIENHSQASKGILPANKIAVLTSLNMAGKYVKLKRDFEEYKNKSNRLADRLTQKIARSLLFEAESEK